MLAVISRQGFHRQSQHQRLGQGHREKGSPFATVAATGAAQMGITWLRAVGLGPAPKGLVDPL